MRGIKNSIITLQLEAEDHNFNDNSLLYGIRTNLGVIFLLKSLVNLIIKLQFFFIN